MISDYREYTASLLQPGQLRRTLEKVAVEFQHQPPASIRISLTQQVVGSTAVAHTDVKLADLENLCDINEHCFQLHVWFNPCAGPLESLGIVSHEGWVSVDVHAQDPQTPSQIFDIIETELMLTKEPPVAILEHLLDINQFHPSVTAVASKLFSDGQYRQAILDTYRALTEAVQQKAGSDLDGSQLMQHVFRKDKPLLKVSDRPDEQVGGMWLFSGAVMHIRTADAHNVLPDHSAAETLEWLAFASALFRMLEKAQ